MPVIKYQSEYQRETNLSSSIFRRRRISRDGNEGGRDSGLSRPISVYHAGLSTLIRVFTQIYRSVYSRFDITEALRFGSRASALCHDPSGTR